MKRVNSIFIVAGLALMAACGGVQSGTDNVAATSKLDDAGHSQTVCSIENLPDGWVVTAHTTYPLCGQSGFSPDAWNAYVIAPVSNFAVVCDDSPIPAGYIKKNPVSSIPCIIPMYTDISYTNAYVIEKL